MSIVTVSKGSSYSVSSGQIDTSDTVLSGGKMFIISGGVASSTLVEAGGFLIVDDGGTEVGLVNSGTVDGSGGVISGTVVNGGLVEASGADAYLALVGSTTNSKGNAIEAIAAGAGGFAELDLGGPVSNSGTVEALATSAGSIAYVDIGGSVDNTSGRIVASGNGIIDLVGGAVISGGTLQTVGAGAAIAAYPSNSATIVSAAIVSNSLLAARGGALTLSAVTFGANDKLEASAGGTLVVSGGAVFGVGTLAEAVSGGTLDIDGTIANAGAVEALAGSPDATATVALSGGLVGNSGSMIASAAATSGRATVTISGGTVSNTKTIAAEATAPNAFTLLPLGGGDATVTINATSVTNAGTLEALAVSGGRAATNATATAIGNTGTIRALASSAGQATMEVGGTVSNAKSAFMVASATGSNSSATLAGAGLNDATVSNSGTIEALAQGGAGVDVGIGGTNQGTIVASAGAASDAFVLLDTIDNTGGRIVASAGSGATAQIMIEDGGVISGGTLQTVGAGAAITVLPFDSATINSATIAANSHIILGQNARGVDQVTLTLNNDTFGAGTVLEVTDNSTLSINGGLSLSAGALIEVLDDSTATISGNVNNAGTIEAIGAFHGAAAISISGDNLTNTGTLAFLAGPFDSTSEFTIGVTSALVNSGTLEIVTTGPGDALNDGSGPNPPELEVSADTIINTRSIVASAGMLTDGDADFAVLSLDASGGFLNSGTISVEATANLPFGADGGGTAQVSASISAGTNFTNTGTLATVASSTFPPGSLRVVSAGTVVSAAGHISNGGLIVASATGLSQTTAEITLIAGGTLLNSGTIAVSNSTSAGAESEAELTISGGTIINTKTIEAISIAAAAALFIDGGNITNSGLIEATGAANFVVSGTTVSNTKTGTILGGAGIVVGNSVVNLGLIEVSATSRGASFQVEGITISNGGTIEALGSGIGRAELLLSGVVDNNGVVDNSGGTLRASGNAEIDLDSVSISGGVVATSGSLAAIVVSSGGFSTSSASISAASIAAGSFVEATSSGTLTLGSGTLIGKGATVEALSGGTVVLSGTVTNSGALLAEQGGSVVITSGASVSGGVAEIGTSGAVVISGDSTENVTFLSGAVSGGLSLADTAADSAGYAGTVSGFGGLNNTDTTQFIDLTSVTYSAGVVSASYAAEAGHPTSGGVLTVTSGGVTVADITLAGNYTHASFDVVSGANNMVEIVDPARFIAGGGTATLASLANDTPSPISHGGASDVALLANYMASLFPPPQGQVVTPGVEPQQGQAVLAHPHTG
jgi:autotransporter passenger strand-loop-strand repeat protein